jgi:UDP-N-acetyl-D-mannosaminuronic acid dehydrogenase
MADICVLGLGYVGLPTASLLANAGFHVLGVDIDPEIVAMLRGGRTRLEEAGLATLVAAAVNSGNLVTATLPEAADTFMICVPTPVTPAKTADLRAVEQATRTIVPLLKPGNLVILESTSPVGTTRDVVGRILGESGLEPGQDFDLCYCPERVLPGNTTHELINNHRLIGGVTPRSAEHAQQVYERFSQGKIVLTDDKTAEMCKLMENTYRDVNIALANVFARIAEDVGINVWEAIEYANLHPRVRILRPGPGVGGHCIPVDPWYLVEAFPQHTTLLRQARLVNDTQAERMLNQLWVTGELKPGKKLAILGAAYKPDIDDPRESPAALLAAAARKRGLEVSVHDPLVRAGNHYGLVVSNDLPGCLRGATVAALLCEHRAYRVLSAKYFQEHLAGKVVADARNWLNHAALRRAGFNVILLGALKDKNHPETPDTPYPARPS